MRDQEAARGRCGPAPRPLGLLDVLEFPAAKPEGGCEMKLKTHPHKSDLLLLSREDLARIAEGEELQVSALQIRLEKPDPVHSICVGNDRGTLTHVALGEPNLRLTFDGETNRLKTAEVIE